MDIYERGARMEGPQFGRCTCAQSHRKRNYHKERKRKASTTGLFEERRLSALVHLFLLFKLYPSTSITTPPHDAREEMVAPSTLLGG